MKRSTIFGRAALGAFLGIFSIANGWALEKLQPTTRADAGQDVEFNVYLPLQHTDQLDQLLVSQQDPKSPNYHKWLTPAEFRARFGADGNAIARVSQALESYGLTVVSTNTHGVHVRGKVSSVENAFAVSLWNGITASHRTGILADRPLTAPPALAEAGAKVAQFSPVAWHHIHSRAAVAAQPQNRYGVYGPYWFDDLKQAYDFPSAQFLHGLGVNIGILMSSDYNAQDMVEYFGHEKISPPQIIRRPVEGGAPFNPATNGASYEVELDIQQSGGMAPGATITLYNIPDLGDDSILAGYLDIVEDNAVDVVSSSFGGPELGYSAEYNDGVDYSWILRTYDDLFKQGNAQGITFVASSGDEGGLGIPSLDYFTTPPQKPPIVVGHFIPDIDTPASSVYVTAVGGTNLATTFNPSSTTLESEYVSENADADPQLPYDPYGVGNLCSGGYFGSGGGTSIFFLKPDYQNLVDTGSKWRTIPDVSLQMGGCPVGSVLPCSPDRSFVIAIVGGTEVGLVGTSISSPDFAGLLALEIEHLQSRLGNVNYQIYSLAAQQQANPKSGPFFHQDIPGFDGYYSTNPGYNYVVGNGTVFGRNFIQTPTVPAAGNPQTPSNP
ncbi:MAG: protease pro-enzyme activation domain-containing protein [Bryobacteraceae bacterium]